MNILSYRISLYKLTRERDKEDKRVSKLVNEAERKGGRAAGEQEWAAERFEFSRIDDEISYLNGRFLINKAERMSIPTPPITDKDDLWESSNYTGRWFLTTKGIAKVRQLIRQEQKVRLEIASHWAGIIIGIIGAITGLIAVIMK
ncbi:MAG: hypothetical protein HY956_03195 [Deltaproteobacteria bacterium]|nr:hypothetical protein [Deltaproteobacteria bacterium]